MLASRREEPSHLSLLFWCCRPGGGLQRRACPRSHHSRKSDGVRPWLVCHADGRGGRCERCGRGGGSRVTRCRVSSGTAGCGVVWLGRAGGPIVVDGRVIGVGFPVGAVTTLPGRLMRRGGFFFWLALPAWAACRRTAGVTVDTFSSSHSSFVTAVVLSLILGRSMLYAGCLLLVLYQL